jgi:hypothetical protein
MTTTNSNVSARASIGGLFFALALIWIFGRIASTVVLSQENGFIMFILGTGMALAAGYGAVAIPHRFISRASLDVIGYGLIVIVAIHLITQLSHFNLFSKSTFAYLCAILGANWARNAYARTT